MKPIYTLLSIFIFALGLSAQAPSITTTNACGNTYTGVSYVNFNNNTSTYPLPYTGSYYNVTSGDYKEFVILTNPHIFRDLYPGEYEFQINLSSDMIMEYCETILNDGIIINSREPIVQLPTSCVDPNGGIRLVSVKDHYRRWSSHK